MRCRWGFASFLAVLIAPLTVHAQEADVTAGTSPDQGVAPSQAIAYGAMPGGLHAPSAEVLPVGAVEVSTLEGLIPDWAGLWFAVFPTVETLLAQAIAAALVIGSYAVARRNVGARAPG